MTGVAAPGSIRVVIVDDEPLARDILREMLAAHDDVAVVAECANGFEAVRAVADRVPDLLLLDVQMPRLDGFDVLELVGRDIAVVFVTAYDEYAIRAFEVHAVDYLLKPFGAERLAQALGRVRERLGTAVRQAAPVQPLLRTARPQRTPLQRVLVRHKADVHVIPTSRIDYIEAQDDYAAIHTGGRTLLKDQTLSELEALLDPATFVRIHRRYVLNLTRLARLEPAGGDSRTAVLADGTELPVSRAGYTRLKERL